MLLYLYSKKKKDATGSHRVKVLFRFNKLRLTSMKRLGMAVAALLFCATISNAQSFQRLNKEPFAVNTEKLSSYLQLTPAQLEEVSNINTYFIEKQNESMRASVKRQDKKMCEAVYGNLKLMKRTLTPEQYRKYIVLLNVTNNNNRLKGIQSMPDVYLAEK